MNRRIEVRGFTLIEVIITMTIVAIIAGVVMVFIQKPIQGYFAAAQRAELTSVADTAVRRIARDLRQALPNSIRVVNGTTLEFLAVSGAARYRDSTDSYGNGNVVDTSQVTTLFDILGPKVTFQTNDQVVIYNLGPSVPGADAYAGDNRRTYSGVVNTPVSQVNITSTVPFPFNSPAHRFFVVNTPVTYLCENGSLVRHWNYPITAAQPTAPGGMSAKLADQNATCTFTYAPGINARLGLASIELSVTLADETVKIYQEVHVSNSP